MEYEEVINMNWVSFLWGVASSILATVICAIFAAVVHRTKKINLIMCKKAIKRILETHMTTFYYNRNTLNKDMGNISDFLKKSKYEIYHVGFWLSSTLDNQNLKDVLVNLITNGKKVHLCLLDPESGLLEYYADFFGMKKEDISNKITASIHALQQVKSELPQNLQANLNLYLHNKMNTTSIWALDINNDKSCVFVDHKMINSNRFHTYGFEISGEKTNEFEKMFGSSVLTIIHSSKKIE